MPVLVELYTLMDLCMKIVYGGQNMLSLLGLHKYFHIRVQDFPIKFVGFILKNLLFK
jgi:hypothetical protein